MANVRLLALLALVAAAAAVPFRHHKVAPRGTDEEEAYRLPGDAAPVHYEIALAARVPEGGSVAELAQYSGYVRIDAIILKDTDRITLHAASNIEPGAVTVTVDNIPYTVKGISRDTVHEFLIIDLLYPVEKDESVIIEIAFLANFSESMDGFYKSTYTYTGSSGEEEVGVLMATQMEPTYAREAVPCFDEPGYKATINLRIQVPDGYKALSNTPIESLDGNLYTFKETPKMSIYLLAFLLYDTTSYKSTSTVDSPSGVHITSWAPKDALEAGQADYSQRVSGHILNIMEQYTGIPFKRDNMEKIDEVAIPDFTAGAMENWGLVTYREDTILVDPEQSTEHDREYITQVISHEFGHQWFGNLVSPAWWEYTWLNEGFARFFQYWTPGQLNPEWRMDERFLVEMQQSIFEFDALESALPLTTPVYTPSEIVERFGAMSYNKGSSVLRMVKYFMGESNFQAGIHDYLEDAQYGSGTPERLFAALARHIDSDQLPPGVSLAQVLESWTTQPGFPVVGVLVTGSASKGWDLDVSQQRFFLSQSSARRRDSEQYYVPLRHTLSSGVSWLEPGVSQVGHTGPGELLVFNATAYNRINYDAEHWARLAVWLKSDRAPAIEPIERAQLVDDALNLARAGYLNYASSLDLVRYLSTERDIVPWSAGFAGLDYLQRLLANVDEEGLFNTFLLNLLEAVYDSLGFVDTGGHLDKLLRAQVLSRACAVGRTDCLQTANDRLAAFLSGQSVEPDLKSVVYCYGVKASGEEAWEALWNSFQTTSNPGERSLLLSALGCSDAAETLKQFLEYSLDSSKVRQQDAAAVFTAVYSNPVGVDLALDFLVSRFDEIKQSYGAMRDIGNIVRGIAAQLSNEEQYSKMSAFVEANPELGESGAIALDTVRANVEWLAVYKDAVLNALRDE